MMASVIGKMMKMMMLDILSICSVQEVDDSCVIAVRQLSYISPAGNFVWMACNTAWANFLLMCIDRELATLVLLNISPLMEICRNCSKGLEVCLNIICMQHVTCTTPSGAAN